MSKREKIIIVLTVAVALYGLLELLLGSRQPPPVLEQENLLLKEFSATTIARIAKLELQEKKGSWQAWIGLVESEWDRDPFIRYDHMDENSPVEQISAADSLVFSGYIRGGNMAFAVINGMEYKKGETVDPQGFTVKEIFAQKVVLQRGSDQVVLNLKEE